MVVPARRSRSALSLARRWVHLSFIPLLSALPLFAAEAQQPGPGPITTVPGFPADTASFRVVYDRDSNLLSIRAVGAELGRILDEVAARAGFSIALRAEPFNRVSVDITDSPLETALRQLLAGFNLAFIYASTHDAPEGARDHRLARLIVVPRGPTTSPSASVSGEDLSLSDAASVPVPSDRAALVRGLVEGSFEVVTSLVRSLERPGNERERERVIEVLLGRLQDKRAPVPEAVLTALKELAPEEATDLLLEHLRTGDPQMQSRAAAYLGRFADNRAVESLFQALMASSSETRRAAATSLALIGSPQAVDVLLNAYQATDDRVRYPAWLALVSHGNPQSQGRLGALIAKGLAPPAPPAKQLLPQQ